jgi:predicted dehydrogenase
MKIAVLGAGTIVPDFLEAASEIPELEIYAIWGRESSRERMVKFKEQHGIAKMYFDYQELLCDEQVEAVYVALPNHLHFSYAKEAAEHGKHVILEKPFASTYEQAKELLQIADKRQVVVFEAISNQYMPNYRKTKKLLGEVGEVRIVQMNFSQYSRRYDQFKLGNILPVFDPKQSGGALMDLNVYNIHFVLGLFGKPKRIHYQANIRQGIDTSGILTMEYPNFQCVCVAAKDCGAPANINIQGDAGCLHSDDTSNFYNAFSLCRNGEKPETYALNEGKPRLYHELRAFVDMVAAQGTETACEVAITPDAKKAEIMETYLRCCAHTLDVQEILDEARRQVGIEL